MGKKRGKTEKANQVAIKRRSRSRRKRKGELNCWWMISSSTRTTSSSKRRTIRQQQPKFQLQSLLSCCCCCCCCLGNGPLVCVRLSMCECYLCLESTKAQEEADDEKEEATRPAEAN